MTSDDHYLPSAVWPPVSPAADDLLGSAFLEPHAPVVAGDFTTLAVTYVCGRYGIDDGGAVRIAIHTISDWEALQFTQPGAPNYCTVSWTTPHPCTIEAHYDAAGGVRPWRRVVTLRARDASIRPGDRITLVIGDRSGGSPGTAAQTFAGLFHVQVLADVAATGIYLPVAEPLAVQIVAGPADHLRVHAPSDVTAGTPFAATVVTRDRWGNVVSTRRRTAVLDTPGVHVRPVEDPETGLRAESNPIRCRPVLGEGERDGERKPARDGYRVFWGDLHAQTEETTGSGTLDEYFRHARDCAAVDFAGHQGNDFQITRQVWERIMRKTQEYDDANQFITFAGYEWSGNTPGGGDHNVHFKGGPGQRYDLHRSGHWQVADRTDEDTDRFPVTALYETFRGRDDVILIPHVGGRYANLRECFDESLMPLVEVCSCWGVFEWFAADAFERGATFGFSAGSDDHTARPGMSHAPRGHFATGGGLTAVLSTGRSREEIWDALRARRTYATTGARLLLDVWANDQYPMGSAFECAAGQAVALAVSIHATAPLWRVEVIRWPEVQYVHPFEPAPAPPDRHRLRIGWTGSRIRARNRLTRWDGALRLVSDGGRVVKATGWGFDHPENGIVATNEREVRWRSETAGDWDGIVVEVEAADDATIEVSTPLATFTFRPCDAAAAPLEVDAGGVGQRVRVERDPGPDQPRGVSFVALDTPPPGRHPYFVRVTQQDGHIAWSSPIYVTVR